MSAYPVKVVRVPDDYPMRDRTDLLTAPRPLFGVEVAAGVMGFQVIEDPEHEARNLALDAHRLRFVTDTQAVEAVRAWVVAEYGADALDGLDDDDLAGMFRPEHLEAR